VNFQHHNDSSNFSFPGPNGDKGSPQHGLRIDHPDEATHWKTPSDGSVDLEADSATVGPSISSEYKKKKPKKMTQWADGGGETTARGALHNPLEIVIDSGHQELDTLDNDEASH